MYTIMHLLCIPKGTHIFPLKPACEKLIACGSHGHVPRVSFPTPAGEPQLRLGRKGNLRGPRGPGMMVVKNPFIRPLINDELGQVFGMNMIFFATDLFHDFLNSAMGDLFLFFATFSFLLVVFFVVG